MGAYGSKFNVVGGGRGSRRMKSSMSLSNEICFIVMVNLPLVLYFFFSKSSNGQGMHI
jgi:hypothetical protein